MSLANHFHKVLYPGLKLKYFHEQSWEKEWIDTAKWLVCEEFTDRYKTSAETTDDTAVDVNEDDFGSQQLLHFTCNQLAPSTIHAFLCLRAWGRSDLTTCFDLHVSLIVTSKRWTESVVNHPGHPPK
ncbi:hypothetical protein EV424DRAFT_1534480 [Suillus variegatus]|nr:hypothetical protein EV424DRAFT_1534480 [Suillus variegatus]